MKITDKRIILASNSPRRRELLKGLDIDFTVRTVDGIDESYPEDMPAEDVALFISKKKAEVYRATLCDDELIITADTVVCIHNKVLGKPQNEEQAQQMLRTLSGETHLVVTGVTLTTKEKQTAFSAKSRVTFCSLSQEEISYYVEKYKPLDKAGSYGIQEWIGYVGVEELSGSFFNVMGLPVHRLYKEIKSF